MPRTIETVVYGIAELSETAKERARAWYRESCLNHNWHDAVYEDFEAICSILGVTLRTSPVSLMGGGTRDKPHTLFRGFSSQGDGRRSKAPSATPGARPGPSARMRPRTPSYTGSRTTCKPSSGRISTNCTPRSTTAAPIATNTPWRSRSSGTARPGSP